MIKDDAELKILYSTHTSPDDLPALTLNKDQIIVGPNYPDSAQSIKIAAGRYDIEPVISRLRAGGWEPDLTLVLADSSQQCMPFNIASIPGCKILLVADTHYGDNPLGKMLAYAMEEPFDRIAVIHDPHHLHWFSEANITRPGYIPPVFIPNVNVRNFRQDYFNRKREPTVAFVGQIGKFHSRRKYLLDVIKNAEIPLVVTQTSAEKAATIYNQVQITFNCSLNGELNMRVFEVMAAGGFLITDRLSRQSGLDQLFKEDVHYVAYDSGNELIEKLRYYLANPTKCLDIATAGQIAYLQLHQPARRADDLFCLERGDYETLLKAYAFDKRASLGGWEFGEELAGRVAVYQAMQDFALWHEPEKEQIDVVVDAALGARCVSDLVDLPRLKIRVGTITSPANVPNLYAALDTLGVTVKRGDPHNKLQVEFIGGGTGLACDVFVTDGQTILDLMDPRLLQKVRFLLTTDLGKSNRLKAFGFEKALAHPMLFHNNAQSELPA
jgi:Glycosyl transferases group 1